MEFIWQSGKEVAAIMVMPSRDRTSAGFWLGDGLFETLLVQKGVIFARSRHLRRLDDASGRLKIGFDSHSVNDGLDSALKWLDERTGQIRLTLLSTGDVIVTARDHEIPSKPLTVITCPFPKNEHSVVTGIKTLSYGENATALRYAMEQGFDDVIFHNSRNLVTESALANLLLWDGSHWWTPQLDSGCLPGVTRELLIEFFGVKECEMKISDLVAAEVLALTSSLRDVQGISRFQDHSYGSLNVVDRLRADFQEWRVKNPNP